MPLTAEIGHPLASQWIKWRTAGACTIGTLHRLINYASTLLHATKMPVLGRPDRFQMRTYSTTIEPTELCEIGALRKSTKCEPFPERYHHCFESSWLMPDRNPRQHQVPFCIPGVNLAFEPQLWSCKKAELYTNQLCHPCHI